MGVKTIQEQNANTQAKLAWVESERRRQAAQNNQHITPDNYSRGSVSGNGVFTTSQDFGSASVGDNYLGDTEQVQSYAPVEYEEEARLEDLQEVEGLTKAYYKSTNLMKSIGNQAAGLGINIKQINPNDPNQVELRNQYEAARQNSHEIGNILQRGQEVYAEGTKSTNSLETTPTNEYGVGQASTVQDVLSNDMFKDHVAQVNATAQEYSRGTDKTRAETYLRAEEANLRKKALTARPEEARLLSLAADEIGMAYKNLDEETLDLDKKKLNHKKKMDKYKNGKDTYAATMLVERTLNIRNKGKIVPNDKGGFDVISDAFFDESYGINGKVKGIILDPDTGEPTSVMYQEYNKEGKPVGEIKTEPYGDDSTFIAKNLESMHGSKEQGEINNGIAILHADNDIFNDKSNISNFSGDVSYRKGVDAATVNAKELNKTGDLNKQYDSSLYDWATSWGDSVAVSDKITNAINGISSSTNTDKNNIATKVAINPKYASEKEGVSYYVTSHPNDGKFSILMKGADGKISIATDKNGKNLMENANSGMTMEEVKLLLGGDKNNNLDKVLKGANFLKEGGVKLNSTQVYNEDGTSGSGQTETYTW